MRENAAVDTIKTSKAKAPFAHNVGCKKCPLQPVKNRCQRPILYRINPSHTFQLNPKE